MPRWCCWLVALAGIATAAFALKRSAHPDGPPPPEGLLTGVAPRRQWRLPAESASWAPEQHARRRGLLGRARAFARHLTETFADDAGSLDGDSPLWADLSDFPVPEADAFWEALCNGTKEAPTEVNNQGEDVRPLGGWRVAADTVCPDEDQLEGDFTDEALAEDHCGAACYAVLDIGCQRQRFRLCKLGAEELPASDGSCLRHIPKNRPPRGSQPRPPQERDFWKAFCAEAEVDFRPLFPGRLCTAATPLPGADSEGRCAELTAATRTCSGIFDFQASSLTCRCVPVGASCAAGAVDGSLDGGVFILTRTAA